MKRINYAFVHASAFLTLVLMISAYAGLAQIPVLPGIWKMKNATVGSSNAATFQQDGNNITLTVHMGNKNIVYKGSLSNQVITLSRDVEKPNTSESSNQCYERILEDISRYPQFREVITLRADNGELNGTLAVPAASCGVGAAPTINIKSQQLKFTSQDPIQITNLSGDTVRLISDVSFPFPVVQLKEFSASAVSVANGMASVEISGSVTDQLAEMIADDKARIRQVVIEYISADVDTDNTLIKQITAAVRHTPGSSKSEWRPNPVKSEFTTTVSIPVWIGNITVAIRATNVIGNTGSDRFTMLLDEQSQLKSVTHHQGTDAGLFNPLMIRINDPTLSSDQAPAQARLMNGKSLDLIKDEQNRKGLFRAKYPVIAVAKPVAASIPNVISALTATSTSKISYKDQGEELHWTYTTHSPANYFKYASGTTVKHEVRSPIFEKLTLTPGARVQVWTLNPQNNRWTKDDATTGSIQRKLEKGPQHQHPGYEISLRIGKTDQRSVKAIRFPIPALNNQFQFLDQQRVGRFEVIPYLKTVIVTVDGLAFSSIEEKLNDRRSQILPGFKKVFENGITEKALAALPTITWCNWPGIFAGQPPAAHGVLGNAFFPRERNIQPFASPTALDFWPPDAGGKWDNLMATLGGLAGQAKTNSDGRLYNIYDDLAKTILPGNNKLKVLSVHQWYPKDGTDRVDFTPLFYTRLKNLTNITPERDRLYWIATLKAHDKHAARILDRLTTEEALLYFDREFGGYDVVTVYYPGPDNVAHTIGDKTPGAAGAFPQAPGYDAGPRLPHDKTPLVAIRQHLEQFTDHQFKRLVDSIEASGYLYATVFALTGDHGLHAFHNNETYNLTMDGGLEDFFENLGYKVFKGQLFANQDIVYCPNGGMGHIYIRSRKDASWQKPPQKRDIDSVARQLYIEATGRRYFRPGRRDDNDTIPAAYKNLQPKKNPAFIVGRDTLLDGGALGTPPAIFAKVYDSGDGSNHFLASLRWVKGVDADLRVRYGTIDEFIAARKQARNQNNQLFYPDFEWPEFEQRLNEMNDRNVNGSRTGDIVIFPDGYTGYMTINNGDELNGWHGGASESEAYVPLFFNIPGEVVTEDFIKETISSFKSQMRYRNERAYFRNWELGRILTSIHEKMKR